MSEPAGPSQTARRVAAYRLGFERLAGPVDGDPGADDRLAADVAAGMTVDRSSRMGRYLEARTAFFDRATVNALSRQVSQVVLVGAGYDGRAQRYKAPGVRWWEIDRPPTQDDKRARLARLGVSTDHVTFVGLDLAGGGVAAALVATGFDPDAAALFLAEGLIPYIGADTLRRVLGEVRSIAAPGTRFALSFRGSRSDPAERARFDMGVAALGEPAVGSVTAGEGEVLLTECRWRPVQLTERAREAGFVMAAPSGAQSPAGRLRGRLVTEKLQYDGGREVTVYVPPKRPEAVIYAGDGQLTGRWAGVLEAAGSPATMIVGTHRLADETARLHEYSPGFDPERFAAHERFFVVEVRRFVQERLGVSLAADRTAVFGVSAGGELALAMGLRHPELYGAVLCASPGGGFRPPVATRGSIPRTYLIAGTLEPFFRENASRWAEALRGAGAEVVFEERPGSHGEALWREAFPLMVTWAFGGQGEDRAVRAPERPAGSDKPIRPFDGGALYRALDARRLELGISWRQVADQIWRLSHELNELRHDHPISPSTLTRMATRSGTSCQHALFMLRWLGRTPESFLSGASDGDDPRFALPPVGGDRRLRWNLKLLWSTVDERRRLEGLTWRQLAELIGCTPSQLTGLRTARFATGMDLAMRIVQWLGRPAADFVYPARW